MSDQLLVVTRVEQLTVHDGNVLTQLTRSVPIATTLQTGGSQGPPGPQGVQGVPGPGDKTYHHVQSAAAAAWVINHNLGKYPSVTVIDSTGTEVEGSLAYNGPNSLTVTFTSAFGGDAYLN